MRNQRVRLYEKMIRNVKMFILAVVMEVTLLMLSGCEQSLLMDMDGCIQTAQEYMEQKYKVKFDLASAGISYKGYAQVALKNDELEDGIYTITIYPDGRRDENKDGYYDSYIVISDDYMCHLLQENAKKEMDILMKEIGIENFNSYIVIEEINTQLGFDGFSSDFPIIDEQKFSLLNILNDYSINIHYWIDVPEKVYDKNIIENIKNKLRLLISDDLVWVNIDVYSNENFLAIAAGEKNVSKKEEISFYVEDYKS